VSLRYYFAPGASSLAGLTALEAAGADYEPVRLVLAEGDHRRETYLAVNPHGRVPVLVLESGQVVSENIAILTWIAHRYPRADLLPFDDVDRLARAYELMSWFASSAHVAIAQIWRGERFTDDDTIKAALQVSGRNNVLRALEDIDAVAEAPDDWFLGARFSVIDPYALVFWRWAQRLEIDTTAYPAWAAKTARALEHPAVRAALARESAPAVAPATR
jgi:glutathione S-transferase